MLKKLKELAESATPGPWTFSTSYGVSTIESGEKDVAHAVSYIHFTDAQFITAFDPPTVLKLIAAINVAESALSYYETCWTDEQKSELDRDMRENNACDPEYSIYLELKDALKDLKERDETSA